MPSVGFHAAWQLGARSHWSVHAVVATRRPAYLGLRRASEHSSSISTRAAAEPMVGGMAVAALVASREMQEAGPEAAAPMEAVEGSHQVAQAVAGGAGVAAAMGVLVAAAASASSGR